MITNNEFVSRIVNNLKALTKDGHISRRFVLNIGKTKARFLMSQKLDEMTLFKEDGIISGLDCFELKRVDVKECGIFEFRLCQNLMKSVCKIPDGLFGKNGSGIISVFNVDGSKEYHYITPNRYTGRKHRSYTRSSVGLYTIKDGYLYLLDSTNELVELRLIPLNKWELEEKCSCRKEEKTCKSYWDYDFVCPDRFLDLVVRDTLQEIASIYRTSIPDENGNLDENIKTRTQNV